MAFLVWLIIPGIAFLYAGLARRKSALSLLFQSLAVMGVYVGPDYLFTIHGTTCLVLSIPSSPSYQLFIH
jgi:ammonia channel protein AmtB